MVLGMDMKMLWEDLIEIQSSHRDRHRKTNSGSKKLVGKLPNRIEQGTTLEVIIPPYFEPRAVRYRTSEICYRQDSLLMITN